MTSTPAKKQPRQKECGAAGQQFWSQQIAEAIKAVKADETSLKLQNEFYEKTQHPIDTKQ